MADSVALVTGAAAGIGKAAALAFARAGAKTVISDIDSQRGEEVAHEVEQSGGSAIFVRADVSLSEDVEKLIGATIRAFGRLDCAFNNAGIEGEMTPTAEFSEASFDRVIAINLKGLWLCMRSELKQMLSQGTGGAIVNMSSVAGLVGFPNACPYTASKHAVVGMTKTAALEYAKQGIRVNAICPAVIHTEMIDRVTGKDPAIEKQFAELQPMGRMGTPEETAAAALWLCSKDASFITGHALPVDGGLIAA